MLSQEALELEYETTKHRNITIPAEFNIHDILITNNLEYSTQNLIKIPENGQVIAIDEHKLQTFSLSHILINKKIHESYSTGYLFSKSRSSRFLNNIKRKNEILEIMLNSTRPYSLLGNVEEMDLNQNTVLVRPFLIVPNQQDCQEIYDWEKENEIKYKEIMELFRVRIKN